jgi:hypothetical protein
MVSDDECIGDFSTATSPLRPLTADLAARTQNLSGTLGDSPLSNLRHFLSGGPTPAISHTTPQPAPLQYPVPPTCAVP